MFEHFKHLFKSSMLSSRPFKNSFQVFKLDGLHILLPSLVRWSNRETCDKNLVTEGRFDLRVFWIQSRSIQFAGVASARFPTWHWSIGHNRIVSQCAIFAEVRFWSWIYWAVAGMLWVDNWKVKGRHSKICLRSQVLWVFQGGTPGANEANEPMWSVLQITSDWLYWSFPGRKSFAYKHPLSTLRSNP